MTSSNADQDEEGRGNPSAAALAPPDVESLAAQEAPPAPSPSQVPDDTQSGAAATTATAPRPSMTPEIETLGISPQAGDEPSARIGVGGKTLIMEGPKQGADAAQQGDQFQPHDQPVGHDADDDAMGHDGIPFQSAGHASRARNALGVDLDMIAALAHMSSTPNSLMNLSLSAQNTVAPAQINLSSEANDGASGLHPLGGEDGLESFARIEFADSTFQMTTYAVIIGRDQRALAQAKKDDKRVDEHKRITRRNEVLGLPPPPPLRPERNMKFSKSYVSEEGGMLGPESDGDSNGRPPKRRKTNSTGSSHHESPTQEEDLIMNRQYVSHTPGAAAVDLQYLRPSPHHTPFLGIHSPGPDIAKKTKAISREHLKIQFNKEKNVFEAIPLHRNGFFCDDVHYAKDTVVLRSGARLQIKDIDFTFNINGVERGCTGAEELDDRPSKRRYSEGGKEMSVEFELEQGQELNSSSERLSDLDGSLSEVSGGEEMEVDNAASDDDDDDDEMDDAATGDAEPEQPVKRRGPGRPPKDGIMSKRERRERNKRAQEEERQRQMESQAAPTDPPVKRKVGRPRKHPVPDDGESKSEKRKYKPRKPKEEGENSDAERRRERKERRLARPKSPPLVLQREDFTDEQLAKPNKNYGVLIDEILTEAGPEGLSLKQIYNRISAKYPYYYFCTETKGWESSVRHNLIGNSAFKKVEGLGTWARVPGIELDAGKKKKGDSATAAERAAAAAAKFPSADMNRNAPGGQGHARYPGYGQPPAAGQQGSMPPPNTFQQGQAGAAGQTLGPNGQPLVQFPGQSQPQLGQPHNYAVTGHGNGGNAAMPGPQQPNGSYAAVPNGINGAMQYYEQSSSLPNMNVPVAAIGIKHEDGQPSASPTTGHPSYGQAGQLPDGFDLLANSVQQRNGSPQVVAPNQQKVGANGIGPPLSTGYPMGGAGGVDQQHQQHTTLTPILQRTATTDAVSNYRLRDVMKTNIELIVQTPGITRLAALWGLSRCIGLRIPTEGMYERKEADVLMEKRISRWFHKAIDDLRSADPDAARDPVVHPVVQTAMLQLATSELRNLQSEDDRKVMDLVFHGAFAVSLGLLDIEPPFWWLRGQVPGQVIDSWTKRIPRKDLKMVTELVQATMLGMGFIPAAEVDEPAPAPATAPAPAPAPAPPAHGLADAAGAFHV